jgi:hypothetical protein
MANRTKRTRRRVEKFLKVLVENNGHVANACKAVKIGRTTAYEWRDEDPEFADQWDNIVEAALDDLEFEARRRAYEGVQKPIFYQGVECGSITEYSDSLLMFILKAGRPEKYRERYEVKTPDVKKIEVVYVEQPPDENAQA